MSVKKGSPPPRPPPPKGSQKQSNNNPLSIRFKSLEEDDDEELSVLDSAKSNGSKKESSNNIVIPDSGKLSRFHAVSKSLDEDRLYSPGPMVASKEEKRTLLAGLKDKLSDKFPKHIDKINAISKKFEELSGDSPSTNVQSHVSDSSQQSKNVESPKTSQEKVTMSSSFSSPNLVQVYSSTKVMKVADDGVRKEDRVDSAATPLRKRVPSIAEEDKETVADGIEIVDDFYCEEAFEDFNGSVNFPTDRPGEEASLRKRSTVQKSPIQRIIKTKNAIDQPTKSKPVSMSALMKNVSEESVEYDGNVFFDPKDGNKLHNTVSSDQMESCDLAENKSSQNPLNGLIDSGVPIKKMVIYGLCLFIYLILPIPSFLSGLVIGVILASLTWSVYLWLTKPPEPMPPIKIEPLDELPPMRVPEMREIKPDDGKYKGWMNELFHYDFNNYHINQTHSVFLRLEGSVLRLSRPKVGVPKRAMWDESFPAAQFVHQRYLDLAGSRLYLLPPGLVEKRLWSKKYPLCIALAKPGCKEKETKGSDSSNPGEEEPIEGAVKEVPKGDTKDLSGSEVLTEHECESSVLYLFARTNREKEEWYYRLLGAIRGRPLPNHLVEIMKALKFKPKHRRTQSDLMARHKRHNSTDSLSSLTSDDGSSKDDVSPPLKADIETFAQYMAQLMPAEQGKKVTSPVHVKKESVKETKEPLKEDKTCSISCDPQLVWLNALLGRCFWDFLLQNYWKQKIQEKLEKKLSKIHVPYFIEELQVTGIDLGCTMPVIRRCSKPYLDERGFWVELDVAYDGGFRMTIETKLNLMRLKEKNKSKPESNTKQHHKRSAVTDSEEEDSAESSTDEEGEETPVITGEDGANQGGAGKKLLKYIDKITQSKYFQSATENKYIKKAMEGVSNTRLILTVELHTLVGTLAVNIPPPPSDRLWYGFRGNPKLRLVAKPKVGEREVTVTHVTEWIEKKLAIEFQRVFVMPNMDDLVIPLMMPGIAADSVPPLQKDDSSEV